MLLAIADLALAEPADPQAVTAYTRWFCSASHAPRYDGLLRLAALPPNLTPVDSDVPLGDRAPDVYEIGAGGASGPASAQWIAVDRDAPMETVATALADYGARLRPGESRTLLFQLDAPPVPRPALPLTGGEAKRYAQLVASRAPLDPAAATDCPLIHALDRSPCDKAVTLLGAAIRDETCGPHTAPLLLAWLTLRADRGDGVPVALVPIRATGAPITGEGTWSDVVGGLSGRDRLAFRAPDGAGAGADEDVVIDPAGLSLARRVAVTYPEEAKELALPEGARCQATVTMDERGVPYDVAVAACPVQFHAAVRQAVLQWRWFPPRHEGRAVYARTTVTVVFKLTD